MFKCAICKSKMSKDNINKVGIQCDNCGAKIFYKERPNVKKVLKAR